jgi:hypothetical protein
MTEAVLALVALILLGSFWRYAVRGIGVLAAALLTLVVIVSVYRLASDWSASPPPPAVAPISEVARDSNSIYYSDGTWRPVPKPSTPARCNGTGADIIFGDCPTQK